MTPRALADDLPPGLDFSPRRVGRAGLVEVGGSLALKSAGVIQTVVVARLYGVNDFGAWATALIVLGAVTTLTSLRLDLYLLALPSRSDMKAELDVAFTLSLLLGAAGLLVVFAAAPLLPIVFEGSAVSRHVRILSPLTLGIALSLPAVIWEKQLRYAWPKLPPFIGIVAFLVVAVAGRYWWNWGVLALMVAQLASLAATACAVWLLAPIRPTLCWRPDLVASQVAFGSPLLVSGIASFIAGQGDDLLVRIFHGDAALGHYVVAFYLPAYVLALVEMVGRVAVPALSPLRDSAILLNGAFSLFAKYIAALAVAGGVALAIFAREIILLLYGPDWAPIVPLVRVFSIAFVIRASTGLHWQILAVLFGRTRYLMWTSFATAAFMLVVAPPLIWKFGLMGGAIYSFAQLAVMGPLVRFPLIRSILGDLTFLRSAIAPLVSGLLAAIGTAGVWFITGPSYFLAVGGPVYVAVYILVLFRLDPDLIRGALRLVRTRHA